MSEMFKDCFAYRVKHITPDIIWEECDALEVNECKKTGKCSFYKTEDRLQNDRIEAKKKIKNEMAKIFTCKDDIWRFKEV